MLNYQRVYWGWSSIHDFFGNPCHMDSLGFSFPWNGMGWPDVHPFSKRESSRGWNNGKSGNELMFTAITSIYFGDFPLLRLITGGCIILFLKNRCQIYSHRGHLWALQGGRRDGRLEPEKLNLLGFGDLKIPGWFQGFLQHFNGFLSTRYGPWDATPSSLYHRISSYIIVYL